jgi:uncharacterized protein (DUF3084 family)
MPYFIADETLEEIKNLEEERDELRAENEALRKQVTGMQFSQVNLREENEALKAENKLLDAHAKRWGLQAQKAEAQVRQLQWVLEDMAKP